MSENNVSVLIIASEKDVIREVIDKPNAMMIICMLIRLVIKVLIVKVMEKNIVGMIRKISEYTKINMRLLTESNKVKIALVNHRDTIVDGKTMKISEGKLTTMIMKNESHLRELILRDQGRIDVDEIHICELNIGVVEMIITNNGSIYGDMTYVNIIFGNRMCSQKITVLLYESEFQKQHIHIELQRLIANNGENLYSKTGHNIENNTGIMVFGDRGTIATRKIENMISRSIYKCLELNKEFKDDITKYNEHEIRRLTSNGHIIYRNNDKLTITKLNEIRYVCIDNGMKNVFIQIEKEHFNYVMKGMKLNVNLINVLAVVINEMKIYKAYQIDEELVSFFGIVIEHNE